jgi:glycosyltransferase involved in cell wall biosynthesis
MKSTPLTIIVSTLQSKLTIYLSFNHLNKLALTLIISMVKVSVIVPVKDDKRIFDLIRALEKQTFKDFEVLIADASEKKIFHGKTKLKLRYFHKKSTTIAERLHFMARKAQGKMIAITESDCVPSRNWLKELVSEYEDEKTIIVGTQRIVGPPNYGNLLVPREAFKIPHDKNLTLADDVDWFFTLEEKGFKFKYIDKAVVQHYKNPVKRLLRSCGYGKEHAYVYIKHKKDRRILNSILFQLARSFFSLLMAFLLIIYGIFYKIKSFF